MYTTFASSQNSFTLPVTPMLAIGNKFLPPTKDVCISVFNCFRLKAPYMKELHKAVKELPDCHCHV